MAQEKRTSPAAGKLGKATATGDAGGLDSSIKTPSSGTSANNSSEYLLNTLKLHPVKLRTDLRLEIRPGDTVELWGSLNGSAHNLAAVRLLPRSKEWLPDHVEVLEAELVHLPQQLTPQVRLVL